jgi:hypothetical protein
MATAKKDLALTARDQEVWVVLENFGSNDINLYIHTYTVGAA